MGDLSPVKGFLSATLNWEVKPFFFQQTEKQGKPVQNKIVAKKQDTRQWDIDATELFKKENSGAHYSDLTFKGNKKTSVFQPQKIKIDSNSTNPLVSPLAGGGYIIVNSNSDRSSSET